MIRENILKVRERIASVCARVGCDPEGITIVAVSKGRSPQEIKEAVSAGITDIGENRVQEAILKYNDMRYAISDKPIRWHMVGHLQTNKVKDALQLFDLIQSVDSLHLAEAIDKEAAKINKVQDVLVEVNTSGEATKFGLKPDEAIAVSKEIAQLKNIKIKGLMTIAPIVDDPQKARSYFRLLRELRDKINHMPYAICDMQYLSMGMTEDFQIAIEEGANMIRLGRVIFEVTR